MSTPPVPPRGPHDPGQGAPELGHPELGHPELGHPGPGDPRTSPELDDPTGIRALLSGLGDPGPMPPDLVDRINASIAAEQAARAHPDDRVVPLHDRRTPKWQKYGLVAAAVAGLAIGVPALLGTGPQDVMASLSRSSNDSAGAASSAQEASTASPPAASLTPTTPATPSAADTGARATSAVGRVTMVATGTGYTARRLATQARDVLLSGSTHSTTAGGADHARDADGLRDCLTAMGVPAWTPVVADLATYDGKRAVVAVVSSDTGQTVYAVPTWCDATHARALAGPLPIH